MCEFTRMRSMKQVSSSHCYEPVTKTNNDQLHLFMTLRKYCCRWIYCFENLGRNALCIHFYETKNSNTYWLPSSSHWYTRIQQKEGKRYVFDVDHHREFNSLCWRPFHFIQTEFMVFNIIYCHLTVTTVQIKIRERFTHTTANSHQLFISLHPNTLNIICV